MRRAIFNLILLLSAFCASFLLGLLYAIPKAVAVDRALMGEGVHLIGRGVREDLLGVSLESVRLFRGSEEIGLLEVLSLKLQPDGLRIRGACGSGYTVAHVDWSGSASIVAENFRCLRRVEEISGRLRLDGGVAGRLTLKKVSLKGVELQTLDLRFKGESFTGKLTYMGMELEGEGKIRLERENLLSSKLNARFRGALGTLVVSGRLRSLRVQIQ